MKATIKWMYLVFAFRIVLLALQTTSSIAQDADDSSSSSTLAAILNDRPTMASILADDDVIVRWVARRLATLSTRHSIRWDPAEPIRGPVQHVVDHATGQAVIRLTNQDDISGRDKWFLLVAQLHKVMPTKLALGIQDSSRRGVGESEFVRAMIDLELQRMALAKKFFDRYPIPNATKENAPIYVSWTESDLDLFDKNVRQRIVKHCLSAGKGNAASERYAHLFKYLSASAN